MCVHTFVLINMLFHLSRQRAYTSANTNGQIYYDLNVNKSKNLHKQKIMLF